MEKGRKGRLLLLLVVVFGSKRQLCLLCFVVSGPVFLEQSISGKSTQREEE